MNQPQDAHQLFLPRVQRGPNKVVVIPKGGLELLR
jgi:hypothetical protein